MTTVASTTTIFWAIRNAWREGAPVFEVECFVAPDGKVVPVPSGEYGYTGYAHVVGHDVYETRSDAETEAFKRAEKDVKDKTKWLREAESYLARLRASV